MIRRFAARNRPGTLPNCPAAQGELSPGIAAESCGAQMYVAEFPNIGAPKHPQGVVARRISACSGRSHPSIDLALVQGLLADVHQLLIERISILEHGVKPV